MATSIPDSSLVLQALLAKLAPKPREQVTRRYGHMVRELAYLTERRDENLAFIRSRKWTDRRLNAVFAFNSVYQEVLGPLQASARFSRVGLGREIPILHGSQRFDLSHAMRVNDALSDFHAMLVALDLKRSWMTLNTCGEVVYRLALFERSGRQSDNEDDEL
jgi:hypothetical protein